jgi:hypothetical protein
MRHEVGAVSDCWMSGSWLWTIQTTANCKKYETQDNVPLTTSSAERWSVPAKFFAVHVYTPACAACTELMLRMTLLSPRFTTVTPILGVMGLLLNVQWSEMGRSPSITPHGTVIIWPGFIGRSPNEKGSRTGRTVNIKTTATPSAVRFTRHTTICGPITVHTNSLNRQRITADVSLRLSVYLW